MDKNAIQSWAERFVADLDIGGERVPLDRVIAAHLPAFESLRASGLTWRGIAAIIARAGGRRANGRLISPDHLRADVSRLAKRQAQAAVAAATPMPARSPTATNAAPRSAKTQLSSSSPSARPRPPPASRPKTSAPPPITIPAGGSKDVSDTDIAAALARLKLHS